MLSCCGFHALFSRFFNITVSLKKICAVGAFLKWSDTSDVHRNSQMYTETDVVILFNFLRTKQKAEDILFWTAFLVCFCTFFCVCSPVCHPSFFDQLQHARFHHSVTTACFDSMVTFACLIQGLWRHASCHGEDSDVSHQIESWDGGDLWKATCKYLFLKVQLALCEAPDH